MSGDSYLLNRSAVRPSRWDGLLEAIEQESLADQTIVVLVHPDGLGWDVYNARASAEFLAEREPQNELEP